MELQKKFSRALAAFFLAMLLAVSFVLMRQSSSKESAIMDELAHIPAGYGYVAEFDHRLNPEHPPLVKAIAALPLRFLNLNFPTNRDAWQKDINGQWDVGRQFLYESSNDADQIIQWARIGPILLTLLLVALVYLWAAELMGALWGLMPALLVGLSPHFLAHGHYVTTDVAAAFGTVLGTYYFIRFLQEPTRGTMFAAGIAFGISQIAKFSTVLLIPFFLFLLVVYLWTKFASLAEARIHWKRILKEYVGGTILALVIGYVLVVYPIYFVFTANYPIERQAQDTTTILSSFGNGPTPSGTICRPSRCLADLNIWMSKNVVTRPFAEYMLGILMVLQRAAGGNTNYFLGQVSSSGWYHYFPVVYVLKEPLSVLLIVFGGLALALWRMFRNRLSGLSLKTRLLEYLRLNFAEFAMISFVVFYWAYSMKSPLNIGFRHLFPTLPFIYFLGSISWKKWAEGHRGASSFGEFVRSFFSSSFRIIVVLAILLWFIGTSLANAPYFISYFNPLGGGQWFGYRYVTDSNYDWGQDMLRLKQFVEAHPEIDKIGVDYFGGATPSYYIGPKEVNWWSARGNPTEENIHWLAVSVNTLQGATQPLVPGQTRKPEDEYSWLTALRPTPPGMGNVPTPDFRVGTSIFVYKL